MYGLLLNKHRKAPFKKNKWLQAYLGDIAGPVPDHYNKVNITSKVSQMIFFLFSSSYRSDVYSIL